MLPLFINLTNIDVIYCIVKKKLKRLQTWLNLYYFLSSSEMREQWFLFTPFNVYICISHNSTINYTHFKENQTEEKVLKTIQSNFGKGSIRRLRNYTYNYWFEHRVTPYLCEGILSYSLCVEGCVYLLTLPRKHVRN